MTEIPEHLLKRSRERRASGGAGEGAASDAPAAAVERAAAATPAAPAAPKAAAVAAPPPKPDPAYVVAAKTRRRIPFWAMATLSLLPVWAFLYLRSVTEAEVVVEGPIGLGAEVYNQCSSCHAANGQGGAGRPLWQGSVLATFPRIEDMLNFVYVGTQPYVSEGFESFGDPDRDGGAHAPLAYNGAPMPGFGGQLTDYQVLAVICHERYTLSGADPTSDEWADEYAEWCAPDAPKFAELQGGVTSFDMLDGVGTKPRPSVLSTS